MQCARSLMLLYAFATVILAVFTSPINDSDRSNFSNAYILDQDDFDRFTPDFTLNSNNKDFRSSKVPGPPYLIKTRVLVEISQNNKAARTKSEISKDFDIANDLYGNISMRFVILEKKKNHVDNNGFIDFNYSQDAKQHQSYMSIYYKFMPQKLGISGLSSFPWNNNNGIIIGGNIASNFTLSHEIGHYFGLYHTFKENFKPHDYVNDTIDKKDWDKDVSYSNYNNIMNYSFDDTRTITAGQLERVRFFLITERLDHLIHFPKRENARLFPATLKGEQKEEDLSDIFVPLFE